MTSLRSPGSYLDVEHPAARVGERFFRGSGTSQAAAVVSGAAALLLQQRPGLTPDQVKALLVRTARPLPLADEVAQGAGLVDVAAALAAPTPTDAAQTWPRAQGTGSLELARGTVRVSVDGVPLVGERSVFLTSWSLVGQLGQLLGAGAWTGGSWSGNTWTGSSWTGGAWRGNTWTGSTWTGNTWTGNTWTGNTWTGNTWTREHLDGQHLDGQHLDRQHLDRHWTPRSSDLRGGMTSEERRPPRRGGRRGAGEGVLMSGPSGSAVRAVRDPAARQAVLLRCFIGALALAAVALYVGPVQHLPRPGRALQRAVGRPRRGLPARRGGGRPLRLPQRDPLVLPRRDPAGLRAAVRRPGLRGHRPGGGQRRRAGAAPAADRDQARVQPGQPRRGAPASPCSSSTRCATPPRSSGPPTGWRPSPPR